jgi:dolichyl-phosphate beta-glucosyltransferase
MSPDIESRQLKNPDLSIIIPAYNEARRIGRTLVAARDYAAQARLRCELVVVDDGSRDDTAEIVRRFRPESLPVRLLGRASNRGKGYAVRQGMLAAAGDILLMADADLSTRFEELDRLLPWLERDYDVVIGSRDLPDSRLDPPQPFTRRLGAAVFRSLRRRILLSELRDTQCGFKLFRRNVARDVFSRQTLDGWLFDCEVLALADHLGYPIKEVGITWQNHPETRVNPAREMFAALPTLLKIRRQLATHALK